MAARTSGTFLVFRDPCLRDILIQILLKLMVAAHFGVAIAGGQKATLVRRDGNSCARFSIHGVGCWSLEVQSGWDQMDRRASRAVAGVLRASDC